MKITTSKVRQLLAEQIGVEPEDLNEEDDFIEDLHMTNADLTDFTHKLETAGVNHDEIDMSENETLGELLESLGLTALIEDHG